MRRKKVLFHCCYGERFFYLVMGHKRKSKQHYRFILFFLFRICTQNSKNESTMKANKSFLFTLLLFYKKTDYADDKIYFWS